MAPKQKAASRQKHAKRQQNKPLPGKVLEKLDRKKARLQKKIDKEQDRIKNPKGYKKRQKSYKQGLESLDSQIVDNNEKLVKRLKKRDPDEALENALHEEHHEIYPVE